MPISVSILSGKDREHRLILEDDEYYFLSPWFVRVSDTMGQFVDLYGNAEFHAAKGLDLLDSALSEAEESARRSPERWNVSSGTQLKPVKKELFVTVERKKVLATVGALRAVLSEAKRREARVLWSGD